MVVLANNHNGHCRVAVTGVGLLTALGRDAATSWRRLIAGENGIRRIGHFDPAQYSCKVAAEASGLVAHETGLGWLPSEHCRDSLRMFLDVAREAYLDASLSEADLPAGRVGVAVGTTINYVNMKLLRHYFEFRAPAASQIDLGRFATEGIQPADMFYRRHGDLIASAAAKALGMAGPSYVIDTACAASSHAIGWAFQLVKSGTVDAMIAGGACAIVRPIGILAFSVLGALSRNPNPDEASRPFDRERDGFVMGEGAGAIVLEGYDRAVRRGAKIYAELVGFGSTTNGESLTDPSRASASEAAAMRLALEDGQLVPTEIDYVAAHGTSTPKNDAAETAAVKNVFGSHAKRLMVSSNKGQIGHTISAAGVCSVICAVKALNDGIVPPTAHYSNPDPQCDLDYVPRVARRVPLRAALVNAFAFGGQNAVLALRAAT